MNLLELLDELRAIAQLGITYATNDYDRTRYQRLLELAAGQYAEITGLDAPHILERFRQDIGYITPKLGVAAIILNDQNHILLVRRSDNGTWGLPGGWCEANESPAESIKREVWEETGLEVEVGRLMQAFTRTPSMYNEPHTTCSLLYRCEVVGGSLTPSDETPEVGFYDYTTIQNWHKDHQRRVIWAYQNLGFN